MAIVPLKMAKLKLRYTRSSGLVGMKAYFSMSSVRKSATTQEIGIFTTPSSFDWSGRMIAPALAGEESPNSVGQGGS